MAHGLLDFEGSQFPSCSRKFPFPSVPFPFSYGVHPLSSIVAFLFALGVPRNLVLDRIICPFDRLWPTRQRHVLSTHQHRELSERQAGLAWTRIHSLNQEYRWKRIIHIAFVNLSALSYFFFCLFVHLVRWRNETKRPNAFFTTYTRAKLLR